MATSTILCAPRERHLGVCWGYNVAAQIGDDTTDNRPATTAFLGLP